MSEGGAGSRYDALAGIYDSYHTDPKSLAENRWVARFLKRFLPGEGLIADFGCGTGLLLDLCALPPERYLGVDVSPEMLAAARRKRPAHAFAVGDIQERVAALPDGAAAAVVSLFGSPSYCDLEPVAREVRRVLRPGGAYWLMFCGPGYRARKTYINQEGEPLLHEYRKRELHAAFPEARVAGLGCAIDRLPAWTPAPVFDAWLSAEAATVGRWAPDACWFLNAVGRKASR